MSSVCSVLRWPNKRETTVVWSYILFNTNVQTFVEQTKSIKMHWKLYYNYLLVRRKVNTWHSKFIFYLKFRQIFEVLYYDQSFNLPKLGPIFQFFFYSYANYFLVFHEYSLFSISYCQPEQFYHFIISKDWILPSIFNILSDSFEQHIE